MVLAFPLILGKSEFGTSHFEPKKKVKKKLPKKNKTNAMCSFRHQR